MTSPTGSMSPMGAGRPAVHGATSIRLSGRRPVFPLRKNSLAPCVSTGFKRSAALRTTLFEAHELTGGCIRMAEEIFDLIIVGAGPGGYVAAVRAAQLGM